MYANFLKQFLCIVSLSVLLGSSQVHAKPPKGVGMEKAVQEFLSKTHPTAFLPLLAAPVLTILFGGDTHAILLSSVLGCVGSIAIVGGCSLIKRMQYSYGSKRRDERVNAAIEEYYVGKAVHYREEESDRISQVARTVHGDAGEILLLTADGNKITMEQVEGVESSWDNYEDLYANGDLYAESVFFATDSAQPLNEVAARLIDRGHGIVKGKTDYFFNNGKISVEVEHNFTDKKFTKAQFLIDRDKILSPND